MGGKLDTSVIVNSHDYTFWVQKSMLGSKKELAMTAEYIELNAKNSIRFHKENIISFRFKSEAIMGTHFAIGRKYSIELMDKNQMLIKFFLKSLYRYKLNQIIADFGKIYNLIYDLYFNEVISKSTQQISNNGVLAFDSIQLSQEGIVIKGKGEIDWKDVQTKDYNEYFAVYSDLNEDIYQTFYFGTDWEATLIYGVIALMVESKDED